MRALIFLLLAGCATPGTATYTSDECGYKWEKRNAAIPEERWTYLRTNDVELHCGGEDQAESCSKRRPEGCEIVLPKYTIVVEWPVLRTDDKSLIPTTWCVSDEYLKHHKQLHCSGWIHPSVNWNAR